MLSSIGRSIDTDIVSDFRTCHSAAELKNLGRLQIENSIVGFVDPFSVEIKYILYSIQYVNHWLRSSAKLSIQGQKICAVFPQK